MTESEFIVKVEREYTFIKNTLQSCRTTEQIDNIVRWIDSIYSIKYFNMVSNIKADTYSKHQLRLYVTERFEQLLELIRAHRHNIMKVG